MKKNVVLLVPQMRHGGAERVVSRLSFMESENLNVKVVIFDGSVVTYDVGSEIYNIDIKPISNDNYLKKTINVFKRVNSYRKYKKINKIDLTYSFGDTANIVNVLSFGRDKKIVSIRGFKRLRLSNEIKDKLIFKPISKFIYRHSDAIVSVSKLMTQTIVANYQVPKQKIITSYNGYNLSEIVIQSEKKVEVSIKNNNQDLEYIISAGTFRNEKGYWHLIKAFSMVIKENENVRLVIMGEDSEGHKNKVENLAKQLNIVTKIIFLDYQKNPFPYFKQSKVYVLSSINEGFPNAMVEAMACGLPVIATDCNSGPREILSPNSELEKKTIDFELAEYGILVNPMSPGQNFNSNEFEDCEGNLAAAILYLLNNRQLLNEYSSKSIERASDFSYEKWMKSQEAIIHETMKN